MTSAVRARPEPARKTQPIRTDVPTEISNDPLSQYLSEIGRYALLTAAEEIELAQTIEAGTEAAELLEAGDFKGRTEKVALQRRVQKGKEAKDTFLAANLRLVVANARAYSGRNGIDLLDLIQEGNLGVIRAVEKFDWRKGFKFSTYATWWIRQAITRGLGNHGRTIRLPVHMVDVVRTVQETAAVLAEQLRRPPTVSDIADASGLDPERVRIALDAPGDTVSLDRPVGSEGDAELGDFVEDGEADDPFAIAADAARREHLKRALGQLDPRERAVVTMRYGLDGSMPRTLSDVGKLFNLTRERIRQIEGRAFAKLRHPSCRQDLESLI